MCNNFLTFNGPQHTNNQQNALHCQYFILITLFSPTCFGRYCCHLQGEIVTGKGGIMSLDVSIYQYTTPSTPSPTRSIKTHQASLSTDKTILTSHLLSITSFQSIFLLLI
jgi:hypothetical protein